MRWRGGRRRRSHPRRRHGLTVGGGSGQMSQVGEGASRWVASWVERGRRPEAGMSQGTPRHRPVTAPRPGAASNATMCHLTQQDQMPHRGTWCNRDYHRAGQRAFRRQGQAATGTPANPQVQLRACSQDLPNDAPGATLPICRRMAAVWRSVWAATCLVLIDGQASPARLAYRRTRCSMASRLSDGGR